MVLNEMGKVEMTTKAFNVENWGEVGESNLLFGVIRIVSGKNYDDLEIGESCVVETKDHKTERITRTR